MLSQRVTPKQEESALTDAREGHLGFLSSLNHIINNNDSFKGKIFDWVIQLLIIISLITFSIGTLPDLSEEDHNILWLIEIATVSIFTAEYLLRILIARKKLVFIFSFYGLIDLISILPFYLTIGIDLRSIRIFRVMRLIRIFKLVRYSSAINRFYRAFVIIKDELVLFFTMTVILLYLAAVGIYYFENAVQPEKFRSVFDSLWWAVTTLTTVGYGDLFPVTIGGRIFTFVVLMIGLGVVAVPTGMVASALSQARDEEKQKKDLDDD